MSQWTMTNHPTAFRVVVEWEDGTKMYSRPYMTIGAARGQLTVQTEGWHAEPGKTGYVERTTGWERVEPDGLG